MKKKEVSEIAKSESKLFMDLVMKLLREEKKTNLFIEDSEINTIFGYEKDGEFIGHNTEIDVVQGEELNKQVLNDFIEYFANSDTISIGYTFTINGMFGPSYKGILLENIEGNIIDFHICNNGNSLTEYEKEYNNTLTKLLENENKTR